MEENQRTEIAKFSILYLKNRMMINQKLISMGENKIDFENFMTQYNKYLRIIEYAEEHPSEIIDSDNDISFFEKVNQLKNNFVQHNVDFIVMTESEIDELMSYIKESIEKYGLNSTDYYNETFFIRGILKQLADKIKETESEESKEKIERLETFRSFVQASENVGFCKTIEGRISYNNKFYISTHNLKPVCRINEEGINEIDSNELENEDLLIADNMYIGNLTNDENMVCIFLEKIINGQRKMKAISYNQEIYDIYG